jgi:hypothetical protein
MRNIEEISHDVFYGMEKYSQITIDYVEEAEEIINSENDYKGTLLYDLGLLLEVINPALEGDIRVLKEVQKILSNELEVDWRNLLAPTNNRFI